MREIKFRGKRLDNGEWVYGYYFISERDIEDGFVWRDIPQIQQRYGDHYQYFDVIPETIGQYTGLKDKNGREIYEGDIVELTNTYKGMNTKSIVEIAFIDFTFAGKWRDENSPSGYMYNPLGSYNFPIVTIEVIGNIYENHELLGEHKSKLFATNIEWDKDDDDTIELPETIEIPEGLKDEEEISDYLTDQTGYCHKGFALVEGNIFHYICKEDRKKVMGKEEER